MFIILADKILDQIGLRRMNAGDILMFFEPPGYKFNLSGYFVMKKQEFKTFKDHIYNEGVKKVFKLRARPISYLGIYFWKNLGDEAGKRQISKCVEKLKTEQDLLNYTEKAANVKMDYSKPLWEFKLLEDYSEEESVLFVKMHHACSDAGGFVGLLSCMNDPDKKMKIDKSFPKISIFVHLLALIFGPLYLGILILINWKDLSSKKVGTIDPKKDLGSKTKFYTSKTYLPFLKLKE